MHKVRVWLLYLLGAFSWSVLWQVFKAFLLDNVSRPAPRPLAAFLAIIAAALAALVVVGPVVLYRTFRARARQRRVDRRPSSEPSQQEEHQPAADLVPSAPPEAPEPELRALPISGGRIASVLSNAKVAWRVATGAVLFAALALGWASRLFERNTKVVPYRPVASSEPAWLLRSIRSSCRAPLLLVKPTIPRLERYCPDLDSLESFSWESFWRPSPDPRCYTRNPSYRGAVDAYKKQVAENEATEEHLRTVAGVLDRVPLQIELRALGALRDESLEFLRIAWRGEIPRLFYELESQIRSLCGPVQITIRLELVDRDGYVITAPTSTGLLSEFPGDTQELPHPLNVRAFRGEVYLERPLGLRDVRLARVSYKLSAEQKE